MVEGRQRFDAPVIDAEARGRYAAAGRGNAGASILRVGFRDRVASIVESNGFKVTDQFGQSRISGAEAAWCCATPSNNRGLNPSSKPAEAACPEIA